MFHHFNPYNTHNITLPNTCQYHVTMCNYTAGFAATRVHSYFALPKNDTDGKWQCIISQP